MKIEKIKEEGTTHTYLISDTRAGFLNALRRVIISEVPVLAIEDVSIVKNNSALYDEILAHRLGLIPLITPDTYVETEHCKCKGKGCGRCSVKLTLKSEGPKTLYSKELKSLDPSVKPVFDDIPIVLLRDKHEIEFEATAILGKGKNHSKWSGAACYHQNYPKIKIDSAKIKNVKACVDSCPKKVLVAKGNSLEVNKDKIVDCDLCLACEEACEGIKVEGDESKFIFTVESWGQIQPQELLKKAVDITKEKLEVIRKSL